MTAVVPEKSWEERAIDVLRPLVPTSTYRGNPGALAELRRYIRGQHPSPSTIAPLLAVLPDWAGERHLADLLLVASLFALHPEHSTRHRSFGASLGHYRKESDSAPVDDRLRILLSTPRSGLGYHLRQAITLLAGRSVSVNYAQLLSDVLNWEETKLRADGLTYAEAIRLRWLRDYSRVAPNASLVQPIIMPESEEDS